MCRYGNALGYCQLSMRKMRHCVPLVYIKGEIEVRYLVTKKEVFQSTIIIEAKSREDAVDLVSFNPDHTKDWSEPEYDYTLDGYDVVKESEA